MSERLGGSCGEKTDFLSCLNTEQSRSLLSLGTLNRYEKGDYLFRAGTLSDHVYIIEDGRAKVSQLSAAGKEVILWFCLPGEMFGLAEMQHSCMREVFAQVCTDASMHVIPRESFIGFLRQHPDVSMHVIDLLYHRMRILGQMVTNLIADDVTSRIIKLILRLAGQSSQHLSQDSMIQIPLTHQEIADMVGATRQTVTKVLNELKRKGLLRTAHRCIEIQRKKSLENLATGNLKSPNDIEAKLELD